MFRQLNVPIIGVVENMSYLELPDGSKMDVFGTGGGKLLAQQSGVPFIGSIPMDPTVRVGGDLGEPVVVSAPDLIVAKSLISIAENVAAKVSVAALSNDNVIPIEMIG